MSTPVVTVSQLYNYVSPTITAPVVTLAGCSSGGVTTIIGAFNNKVFDANSNPIYFLKSTAVSAVRKIILRIWRTLEAHWLELPWCCIGEKRTDKISTKIHSIRCKQKEHL